MRMLLIGTNATSPPLTASKAGGRVRSAHAHSTRRSSPFPPPSSSVPGGSTPRHTSLTVIAGAFTAAPESEALEVLVELPLGHLAAVVVPLERLGLHEALGKVIAQGIQNCVVGAHGIERVLE